MNEPSTMTKTKIKTSTKAILAFLAVGGVVAGMALLRPTFSRLSTNTRNVPTPVCTESNWTRILSPSVCPASGMQIATWVKKGDCVDGVKHPDTEEVPCTNVGASGPTTSDLPICTEENWTSDITPKTCPVSSGVQTRIWIKKVDCAGGVTHVSSEQVPCTYDGAPAPATSTPVVCTEADWTSMTTPRTCPASGMQTRTWIKTGSCVGGVRHTSPETVYCIAGM